MVESDPRSEQAPVNNAGQPPADNGDQPAAAGTAPALELAFKNERIEDFLIEEGLRDSYLTYAM
ncbi:MAG: hypothetical protein MUP47_09425, partial [Phycisphaerae bacterium]|nr:hypothetical protein [Phycisphaerae bacterium]